MSAGVLQTVLPAAWSAVPLGSGMTARGGAYTPQSRLWLDMVQLRGAINGTITTGSATIGTLAAAYRPAATIALSVACSSGYATIAITTAGVMTAFPTATASWISLDGLWFPLVT